MSTVFLKIVNMSITAGWIVLAVIALRVLLKKAPRWIRMVLWVFVALRLICPISVESVFSLIPSSQTLPTNLVSEPGPQINSDGYYENVMVPADNTRDVMSVFAVVWIAGIFLMLIYALISFLCVRRQVCEAIQLERNVWLCDGVKTPFILGIVKPQIYVPSSISEGDLSYVLAHENAHLKRRDHIWKPLGFFLLTVYWFHPLLWLAYILLCQDIELACDEKVLHEMGSEWKKAYAEALVNCSVPRRRIAACPLAFGENNVEGRVKNVLNYKKPVLWIVVAAVLVCAVAAVCLLTNPKRGDTKWMKGILASNPECLYFSFVQDDPTKESTIALRPEDKTCHISLTPMSSYRPSGYYKENGTYLTLKVDGERNTYKFRKEGTNLIFVAEESSKLPSYQYGEDEGKEPCIPDGAIFEFKSMMDEKGRLYDEWGISVEASLNKKQELEISFAHSTAATIEGGELETDSTQFQLMRFHDNGDTDLVIDMMDSFAKNGKVYTIQPDAVTEIPIQLDILEKGEYFMSMTVTRTKECGDKVTRIYTAHFSN